MAEVLLQGAKDVFLVGVRADFNAIEDQALKTSKSLSQYNLLDSDPMADTLFTEISANESEGQRAVWRHVGISNAKTLGTRAAGQPFSDVEFIRTYETAVTDPDNQIAGKIKVPKEREAKESSMYKSALSRARKLMSKIEQSNVKDPFEVFNLAFTATSSYPTTGLGGSRFFARGNRGTDGNATALGERLVSVSHARADAGTAQSNAVVSATLSLAFDEDSYWSAREQGATFKDDVGDPCPKFGGKVSIVIPNANGYLKSAKEIQESDWEVQTAENQINVHKGMFSNIITSPYLLASAYVSGVANTHQWFLVDTSDRDPETGTGLVAINFIPLESNVYYDDEVRSTVYDIAQEKVFGFVDWRSILGSVGDGAAYTS